MTTTLSIRLDQNLKRDSQKVLKKLGLDVSSATKMFLTQVVTRQAIPFQVRTINGFTPEFEAETLADLAHMKANMHEYKGYTSGKGLLDDILGVE